MSVSRPAAAVPRLRIASAAPSVLSLLARLARMPARHRQRRDLAELDDRLLDDIGLTRADAKAECRKPPWR